MRGTSDSSTGEEGESSESSGGREEDIDDDTGVAEMSVGVKKARPFGAHHHCH